MDSSHSHSQQYASLHTKTVLQPLRRTSLPDHSLCLYFLSVFVPLPPPGKQREPAAILLFFVCGRVTLWRQFEKYAVVERAGETASVSLSASLQPSFMPLSLAQRLTLSTPLSLLTLLHTESRCWPQHYIDRPLRQLINSSGCANGVHKRGEDVQTESNYLFASSTITSSFIQSEP